MTTVNKRRVVAAPGSAHFLPEEIMTEVFLHLPIKSILRFRAVCRSWNAELSSDEFCRLHMAAKAEAEPSPPPNLFFTSPTAGFDATAVYSSSSSSGPDDDGLLFTLDDVRGSDFVHVTPAPCRGLTLLHDPFAPAYHVFNASTRAVTRLPPCQDADFVTAGLGFDARTNKYKVVRLCRDKRHIKCEIYTLGGDHGDQWKPPAAGVPLRFCKAAAAAISHARWGKLLPVFANGFLHWLLCPKFVVKRPRDAILSFSVTDETFAWVRSPPFETLSGAHLVELGGHLCMVRDLRHAAGMLEIWKLNDYHESGGWSLEHRIDLFVKTKHRIDLLWQHVDRADLLMEPQIVRVLGSIGNGGSSSSTTKRIVIATSKRKVVVYDPVFQSLEETVITIRKTHSRSYQDENLALTSISLLQESLVPVQQTNAERALSAPLAKAAREILLRLPAHCTMRCKLVCKQWLSLIESNSFARSYHSHNNMDKRPKIMLVGNGVTRGSVFSFTTCSELLKRVRSHGDIWLKSKVVCSKTCHGMNLLSTQLGDYLYNPCTGFSLVYNTRLSASVHVSPWNARSTGWIPRQSEGHGHAFALGSKNIGLGFNLSTQDHVIVELFYHEMNFESRRYFLTCEVFECSSGSMRVCDPPPLPVRSDMPPAYLAGMLYWMTDPRLGDSDARAVVSFDITTLEFVVFACPPCIAMWNSTSVSTAFVVELEGTLCAVLADPDAETLSIWKRENGEWRSAYTVYLEGWPGYSLRANVVVVPWAVDPKDGKILLNTGRKLGFYDPATRHIENLYDLDEVLRFRSTEKPSRVAVPENPHIAKLKRVIEKLYSEEPRLGLLQHKFSEEDPSSPALIGGGEQCLEERRDSLQTDEIMPLVPMLYEESLASYSQKRRSRVLLQF